MKTQVESMTKIRSFMRYMILLLNNNTIRFGTFTKNVLYRNNYKSHNIILIHLTSINKLY